ncbi:MAG: alkaline phosphatase family protein [Kofleriaceae bacterium]
MALARGLALLLAVVTLAGCPRPAALPPPEPFTATPPAPGAIRLVVLLVIDQLPAWSFEQKRPALTAGFERLLRGGAWHTGDYPSAATITSPSHAMLGTGEAPSVTGILANAWWDRTSNATIDSVRDADGVTTSRLRVPGLADALAERGAGGKALGISLKARSAILVLGHHGTAIWFDPERAGWAASPAAPDWLDDYNLAHPIASRRSEAWTPLDPARIAQLAQVADDAPGELGDAGFGATFPHDPSATKHPIAALLATPAGNDIVLDLATAAIEGQQLGRDDVADLLVISLSAHDYVGHAWGHESWEAWDTLLRLDRRLDQLLADLDRLVGADRWTMIATSDHGASPMPVDRITISQLTDAANRAAFAERGPGTWISAIYNPTVYLSPAALALANKPRSKLVKKIVYALRSFPGLARVERTVDVAGNCGQRTGDTARLCLAVDKERSGEIVFTPRPGWIIVADDDPNATSHGSLHPYDRQVPLIVLGPRRTSHAAAHQPSGELIDMRRVAGVLATWLGVAPLRLSR